MGEKKNGKIIFALIMIIVLALQPWVRKPIYDFFSKHDIMSQMGIRDETKDKVKSETDKAVGDVKEGTENLLQK